MADSNFVGTAVIDGHLPATTTAMEREIPARLRGWRKNCWQSSHAGTTAPKVAATNIDKADYKVFGIPRAVRGASGGGCSPEAANNLVLVSASGGQCAPRVLAEEGASPQKQTSVGRGGF